MHRMSVRFHVRECTAAPYHATHHCAQAAGCTMQSVRCLDLSCECMSFKLFAVARLSYPGGRGISRYIGATIRYPTASHCREQAKEDTML